MINLPNAKRVIFITDTHLGIRNNSTEWIEIHEEYFKKWFIPFCKKIYKKGDVLVHLGDVYDSRQSLNLKVLNLGVEIFEGLSEIFKDGIYVICGNHDIFGRNSNEINSLKSLKWIPKVKIFEEPETIIMGTKKIFLMPWRKDHTTEREILSNIEGGFDYLFCHTDIKGLLFNKFVRIEGGLSYDEISKFERVYSGHIHFSQNFGKVRMLGSPYQLTRSDLGNLKGITVLDLETGEETFFENKISPKFTRISFDEVLNSTPEKLNPIFKNNFVDILIDPQIAVKAPLGILSEYIESPRKISFTPIEQPDLSILDEGFHDLEGKNFSILELTKIYLENKNYESLKKDKIYKAIQKLLEKVTKEKEEKDEDQED
jgi:DNA repair exonuclease SbcCD nuclease subunit